MEPLNSSPLMYLLFFRLKKPTTSKKKHRIPDQIASEVQSPLQSCSSSLLGTDKMTGIDTQTHPPCPITTDLATACSPPHAKLPRSHSRITYQQEPCIHRFYNIHKHKNAIKGQHIQKLNM